MHVKISKHTKRKVSKSNFLLCPLQVDIEVDFIRFSCGKPTWLGGMIYKCKTLYEVLFVILSSVFCFYVLGDRLFLLNSFKRSFLGTSWPCKVEIHSIMIHSHSTCINFYTNKASSTEVFIPYMYCTQFLRKDSSAYAGSLDKMNTLHEFICYFPQCIYKL